jgi:predicted NAD/FAD-dependent oxidoreductase
VCVLIAAWLQSHELILKLPAPQLSSLAVNMAAQKRSVLLAAVAGVLLASFVLLALPEPADAAADQLAVSGEWQSSNRQLAGADLLQQICGRDRSRPALTTFSTYVNVSC